MNIWKINFKICMRILSTGDAAVYFSMYHGIEGGILLLNRKRPDRKTDKGRNRQFTDEEIQTASKFYLLGWQKFRRFIIPSVCQTGTQEIT